jgi:hypothetical protein
VIFLGFLVWLFGFLAFWLFGFLAFWLFGFLVFFFLCDHEDLSVKITTTLVFQEDSPLKLGKDTFVTLEVF